MVQVKSEDISVDKFSALDIHLGFRTILGPQYFDVFFNLMNDVSAGNGGFSTLDIVLMRRSMGGIYDSNIQRNYEFWDKNIRNQSDIDSIRQYYGEIIDRNNSYFIFNSSKQKNMTFTVYQPGMIEKNLGLDCKKCGDTSLINKKVLIENINFKKGQTYLVPIFTTNSEIDREGFFKFKYTDIEIKGFTQSGVNLIFNNLQEKDFRIIAGYNYQKPSLAPIEKLGEITILAKEDISSLDAIKLVESELVAKIGSCSFMKKNADFIKFGDCMISWPKTIKLLKNCEIDSQVIGYPTVIGECTGMKFSYQDSLIKDAEGNCVSLERTWKALNIFNNEILFYNQSIAFEYAYLPTCKKLEILLDQPKTLSCKYFLDKYDSTHNFTFNLSNPSDTVRVFSYSAPYTETVSIYDINNKRSCSAEIKKLECLNKLNINDNIQVFINADGVYKIEAKNFDAGNLNYCTGPVTQFQISDYTNNFLDFIVYAGGEFDNNTRYFNLRYLSNGEWKLYGQVSAKFFTPDKVFRLEAYNDSVKKGISTTVSLFSSDFKDILGFGIFLGIKDGKFLDFSSKLVRNDQVNLKPDFLNKGWISEREVSLKSTDTLFAFTFIPERDGKIEDFIKLSNFSVSSIVKKNLTEENILVNFIYLNKSTSAKDVSIHELKMYPNPNYGNRLYFDLDKTEKHQGVIKSVDGRIVSTFELEQGNNDLQLPNNMARGIFFVTLKNRNTQYSGKLIMIE